MSKQQPPDIHSLTTRVKELEDQISMANHLTLRYESISRTCNELMDERATFAGKLYEHGLRLDPNGTIHPIWMPTDDIVVRFDDKTGGERKPYQLEDMIASMRSVANRYDFDLKQWGSGEGFLRFAEMQIEMNKQWAAAEEEDNGPV